MKNFNKTVKHLPAKPGVYLFKDERGQILYVGKAKSLRSRVRSYFSLNTKTATLKTNPSLDPAKQKMVSKISSLETIVCDNETEALILEANLINKHQPPYNVILRDDKFYLFIKITTGDQYPRVYPVRRLDKKSGSRYFGPYSSARSVRHTLRLLQRLFPYRTEKDNPRHKIFPHPLFGQLPQTSPTDYKLKTKDYQNNIQNIISFLQGKRGHIIKTLKKGIKLAAAQQQYEKAAIFRDQLQAIESLERSQKVFFSRQQSFDAISLAHEKTVSAANVFSVHQGKLLDKNTFILKHHPETSPPDILRQFILQYYRVSQNIPPLILLPLPINDQNIIANWLNKNTNSEQEKGRTIHLATPQRGRKKQLIKLGEQNAAQVLYSEGLDRISKFNTKKALRDLSKAIKLPRGSSLERIETYDISNIQGQLATGSMVVFTNGQPDKSQYRKFRIKKLNTPNDYLMLEEVLTRRLKHLITKGYELKTNNYPSLILIDGGKGQLSTAHKVIKKLKLDLPIAALAKKEEALYIPQNFKTNDHGFKTQTVRLPYNSPALILLQQLRDEAQRFTLSYHQLLRRQRQKRSLLDEIPGLGPKTKKKLLAHFGSLKKIRVASNRELTQLIGPAKTKKLRDWI